MTGRSTPAWVYLILAGSAVLMLVTLPLYPGSGFNYVIFSVLLNALLYLGLRPGSLFFDTFIGVFFWLGFWLKYSVRTVFFDGRFHESVGNFDYSAHAHDTALAVTAWGISGLLAARLVRERFLFGSLKAQKACDLSGLRSVYDQHRTLVWTGFCVLVVSVTLSNLYLGIYQRGSVPRTVLPYGLGGIYTWLLLFGLSSISAVLIHLELALRKKVFFLLMLVALLETFLSNVSLLSRGMILNAGALLLGTYIASRAYKNAVRIRTIIITMAAFVLLFGASIFVVNQLRIGFYYQKPAVSQTLQKFEVSTTRSYGIALETTILFIDRWVGMEGVMAVSSYPDLGWDLWREAWSEEYADHGTSLYDRKISKSGYAEIDLSDRHFVSLPGILGFFFYPGSYMILVGAMFGLGLLGAMIEAAVYRWGGGNLILCSLIALVVAYRYVHFGYVPGRSYLLGGAIVLNIFLIYLLDLSFRKWGPTRSLPRIAE